MSAADTSWKRYPGGNLASGSSAKIVPRQGDAELVPLEAARFQEFEIGWLALEGFDDQRIEAGVKQFSQAQRLAFAVLEYFAVLGAIAQARRHLQIEEFPMRAEYGEGNHIAGRVPPIAEDFALVVAVAGVE